MGIIEKLEGREEKNVARVNLHAIELVLEYVGIKKEILQLSEMDLRLNRGRLDNLIQIIQAAGGDRYINLPGGKALYTPEEFARYGVKLEFLEPWLPEYPQPRAPQFVPGLSMLDLIANLPAEKIRDLCHTRRKI